MFKTDIVYIGGLTLVYVCGRTIRVLLADAIQLLHNM